MTDHPSLPGRLTVGEDVRDSASEWPVAAVRSVHESPYISLQIDTIVDPTGAEHTRAVARPNGAVGVLAVDDDDRVLLVEQYRHPVRHRLLELPAGTLDVEGEARVDAAKRELAEEADVAAEHWEHLASAFATPGYSSEAWEVFLATGLTPVPVEERTEREAEEADMVQWWMPLDEALDAVADGRIADAMSVIGLLALHARRTR